MAAAETARLIASLELQDKLSKGVKSAQGSLGKFESKWDRVSGKVGKGFAIGAAAAAGFVAVNVKAGLDSLASLESAISSVDGAIAQVGPDWSLTGSQIADIANRIERDIGAAFDDKDIVSSTATLIRYGKVVPKNLEKAMEVMTDLAAKTGSVDSASSLLAKAMADPAKAGGKLARVGIILTKAQEKQIKAMVEAGDTAGAQALLLDELAKSTEGAAKASQGPYQRSLSMLQDVTEDAQRALAEGFMPVIERVRDILTKGLGDPKTMQNIRDFGKGLASGLDSLIDIATGLPWGAIGDAMRLAGTGAKAVLDMFTGLPPWVQTAVLTGWGLNKISGGLFGNVIGEIGKGLGKGLAQKLGLMTVQAGVVNVNGGVPGVGPGGGGPGFFGRAATGVGGALGGGAVLGTAAIAAAAATIVGSLVAAQKLLIEPMLQERAQSNISSTEAVIASGDPEKIRAALTGLRDSLTNLNPLQTALYELNANGVKTHTEGLETALQQALQQALAPLGPQGAGSPGDRDERAALEIKEKVISTGSATKDAIEVSKAKLAAAANETTRATERGAGAVSRATSAGAAIVAGAVRASRPIVTTTVNVNVSAAGVSKSVTEQNRYGPGNGSQGGGMDGGMGGH